MAETIIDNVVLASEYENCTFAGCDFTGTGLSTTKFINCLFENCNFSNANVSNIFFNDVKFHNCKLLGVNFAECNPFVVSVYFEGCQMNMVSIGIAQEQN